MSVTSHGESGDEGSGERFGVQFRAQCCQTGWLMAEDFYFPCHLDTTFEEIKQAIHHQRPHISTARLVLEVKGKDVPESKMNWTLRRNTVKNNDIIIVKPTMYDGWFWETKDFYREDFLRKIALEVITEPSAVLSLQDIEERCGALPRPIRDLSVRVLLRLYPEKFFLRHDTTQNKTWVAISSGMQIPTWQPSPVNMGMIKQYAPRRFDWDDYHSVDSMAKVALDINKPGAKLRFLIQGLSNLRLETDAFKKPNAYCTYWWNNDAEEEAFHENFNFEDPKTKVGETEIVDDTHNPEWSEGAFVVETGQLGDMDACALKIEVYHGNLEVDEDDDGLAVDESGRNRDFDELVGVVKLRGRDILSITNKGAVEGNTFPIMPVQGKRARASGKVVDPVGHLKLVGGKSEGFEVMVNCVRDHKEFREYPFHKAMVVAVWNGEETGQTFVAKDRADPGWITAGRAGEVFNFSVPKGTLLKQCELDLQLWVTNVNGGRGKYLGSAIFSAYELEALVGLLPPLEGETEPVYRKHAIVCKAPLVTSHSPTIPRVNRSPIGVQGFMTVVAGPPGLPQEHGKVLELAVMQVNGTHKINFISARVTWNDVRIGVSAPARLHDQDWLKERSFTEYKWSRNREKNSGQFYIPLDEGKRTSGDCELRLELFEMDNGENFVDVSKRLAMLRDDPKGKSFLAKGSPDAIHDASKVVHGGSSIAPDDSVSLVSGRPRAYEHKTAELGKYLGLLCLKREELSELMDNKFAVLKEYSMALDYDRDAIFQKKVLSATKVIVMGGVKGARSEEERLFTIDGLDSLNLYGLFEDTAKKKREAAAVAAEVSGGSKKKGLNFSFMKKKVETTGEEKDAKIIEAASAVILPDEGEPVDLFCVVLWNAVEVGRTQIVSSSSGSVVFDNEHFYVPLTAPAASDPDDPEAQGLRHTPVQNSFTCRLEIEVVDSREGSLGYLKLDGRKVGALLEGKAPQSQVHDLVFSTRFPSNGRVVVKGKVKLSTCGLEIVSPYMVDDAKAAQKARQEAALQKKAEKEAKALKKAEEKQAKKDAKKKAKAEAKAKALAKEAALAAADA